MNKRIKKKQMKLKDFKVGDTIYDRKRVSEFNKLHIGFMNRRCLYSKMKEIPKRSQPRMRGLMNYIYKNRMHSYKTYEHRRFARLLDIYNYKNTINHTPIPIVATKHTDITYSPIIRKEDENE